MRSPLRITAVILVAAALTTACSGSGSGDSGLADAVRAQGEAQDALRVRIGDIEDQISAVLSRDDITDFRTMQETVEGLQARFDELSGAMDAANVAVEDRTATVDATLAQLISDVEALTAALAQLDAELQQLREDQESLQVQFQTHRADDSRHQ